MCELGLEVIRGLTDRDCELHQELERNLQICIDSQSNDSIDVLGRVTSLLEVEGEVSGLTMREKRLCQLAFVMGIEATANYVQEQYHLVG